MQNIKALVIGDAMEDIYHIGHSTRRSAEVDIPIVSIDTELRFPGGAMNVIANLQELGVEVQDSTNFGPKKHRLILDEVQIARWDEDDFCTITLRSYKDEPNAVIISDYAKGSVRPDVIKRISERFSGPFFIDTKRDPTDFKDLSGESFFFPNSVEFLQYQKEYLQLDNVIYKHGATGMTLLQNGNVISTLPALCKHPVSVCGAGDSVLSAFTKRYLETKDPVLALAYANAAAAVVVGKPFTSVATELEIAEYLYIYEY